VWPETYSYTLSIALQANLPVVAFDIGAIGRRIRQCPPQAGHRLLPLDLIRRPDLINDGFIDFRARCVAEPLRKVG
jgi:O-antigen biosynthesis protein